MENEKDVLQNDTQELDRVKEEVNVEKIVKDLHEQGLDVDEIKAELEKMKADGKLTDEDMVKAEEYLKEVDKDEASKLFGMDLI